MANGDMTRNQMTTEMAEVRHDEWGYGEKPDDNCDDRIQTW